MILVHFTSTGRQPPVNIKVRLPAVPSEGDECDIGGEAFRVRTVVWYPQGDEETNEPFVYVVLR